MGYKAPKTLVSGSEGMYICAARENFQRKTNLPNSWKRARIALAFSFTDTAGDNATPIAESVSSIAGSGFLYDFTVGFTNGVNYPGATGSKFVGVAGKAQAQNNAISFSSPNWGFNQSASDALTNGAFSNGTTIVRGGGSSGALNQKFGVPPNTSSFACLWLLDFNLATANNLVVNVASVNNISDVSDVALMAILAGTTGGSLGVLGPATLAGGWWDNTGSNPVDCQYLYVRSPFNSNRLRIHNVMTMQLA